MATALRAPRSPEKAMACLFLILLLFTGMLVAISLTSVSDLHLHHGHLEHHAEHTHHEGHGSHLGSQHQQHQQQHHHRPHSRLHDAAGEDDENEHSKGGVGKQIAGNMAVDEDDHQHQQQHEHHHDKKQHKGEEEKKEEEENKKDRRHEGGDDGDVGDGEGGHGNGSVGDGTTTRAHPDSGDADGHGHGFLHFDHNDEIRADPVGDWVHHRWEDTKHLAHDIYEVGHHAVDAVIEGAEDLTGVHVFHHDEEGEGMSGMGGEEDGEAGWFVMASSATHPTAKPRRLHSSHLYQTPNTANAGPYKTTTCCFFTSV